MNSNSVAAPLGPVMLDVEGTTLDADDLRRIRHPLTGGVILFARNYTDRAQLTTLCAAIHAARPGVPVVTPSGAALSAFSALNVQHISVLTPYLVETSLPMADYFRLHGLKIEKFRCLGLDDDRDMARVDPEMILRAALETDTAQTQAFFLSCTGLQGVDVIVELERQTGKPVVTSNQASAWALMNHAGLVQTSHKWGQIFQYALPDCKQGVSA